MDFSPILPARKKDKNDKKKKKKSRRPKSKSIASIVSSPDEIRKNKIVARNDNRKKKKDRTEKQLEKFTAVTKQNLDSIGDGRLSLKQKSLNVELAGLFNQGKKSNFVKKLAEKQRANKARRQGSLDGLLQGPKIANLVEDYDEANKENIPPKPQFLGNLERPFINDQEDTAISVEILNSLSVPKQKSTSRRRFSFDLTMIEEKRNNLSNSGLSRSMDPWPKHKFDSFNTDILKKKVSKSHYRFKFGDIPQFSEQTGQFESNLNFFGTASKQDNLKPSKFQQNLFTNKRTDDLNFSPENLPFDKLYRGNFETRTAQPEDRSKFFHIKENQSKVLDWLDNKHYEENLNLGHQNMAYNCNVREVISPISNGLGHKTSKFSNIFMQKNRDSRSKSKNQDFDEIVKKSTATITAPREDFLHNQFTQMKSGTKNPEFDKIISASTTMLQKDCLPRMLTNEKFESSNQFDKKIESNHQFDNVMFNAKTNEFRKVPSQFQESKKRASVESSCFQPVDFDVNKFIFNL